MHELDPARLVVWIVGGFVLGATFTVAIRYLMIWRASPGGGRLLPLHVWTVALSYDLLLAALMTRTGPLDWRAWIYVPALCLGGVAMLAMLHHQEDSGARRR